MDDNSSQSSGSNVSDLQRVWGLDIDEALADTAGGTAEAADLSSLVVGMIERSDRPGDVARGGHGANADNDVRLGIPREVLCGDESDAIQTQLTDQGPTAICAPYIKSLLELISKLDYRCSATQKTLVWLQKLAALERTLDETRQKFDEELRAAKEINKQQPITLKYVAVSLDTHLLDEVTFHRILTEWEQEWMDTDQEDEKSAMRQKYEGYFKELDYDHRLSQRDDQILEMWHGVDRGVAPTWYTEMSFDIYHARKDNDERLYVFLQEARDVFAAHFFGCGQDGLASGDVLKGPFGARNIYVRMDDESFTKCKQLYGECPSQLQRKFLVAREFVANSSKGPDGMTDDDEETLNRLFHSIKDSTNKDYEILGGNKFYDVVGDPDIEDNDYFDSEIPYGDRLKAAIGDTGRTKYRWLAFNGLEAFLGLIAYIESHKFTKLEKCFAYIAACGRAGISIDSRVEGIPPNSEIRCIEKLKTLFSVLPSYVPRDTGNDLSSFFAEAQVGMACDVFHELMGTNEQHVQCASRTMKFSFDKQLHLLNFLHDQWEKPKQDEIDEIQQSLCRFNTVNTA
mmetsp:Transcript_26235/g.62352  ORF Transcript_26235/g.62352 Transcript_26235/m.62352 type:complete len:570 (-) Transcript_26235:2486-4195(-)